MKAKVKYPKFKRVCNLVGIPYFSFDVYAFVAVNDGASSSDIAKELGISTASVNRALKIMAENGLIIREEKTSPDGGKIFYEYHAPTKETFYEKIIELAEKASKELYSEVHDILYGKD
ncbi:MAG: MarR family transcriptional regulator [Candidatus Helarchaeales archaeon]